MLLLLIAGIPMVEMQRIEFLWFKSIVTPTWIISFFSPCAFHNFFEISPALYLDFDLKPIFRSHEED